MKKSESNQSLKEEDNQYKKPQQLTTKLTSAAEIKSSNHNRNEKILFKKTIKSTNLRKSFSEDINPSIFDNDNDNDTFITQHPPALLKSSIGNIEKIKSRSRFSVAFQSLRRKTKSTSNKKSQSLALISSVDLKENNDSLLSDKQIENKFIKTDKKFTESIVTQHDETKYFPKIQIESDIKSIKSSDLTPTLKKKKSKLSKRFSLTGIKRKHKFNSRKTKSQLESPTFTSISTQTPGNFELHTPEDISYLTNSQQSLFEASIGNTGRNKRSIINLDKFEKIQKIQLPLSESKNEKSHKQQQYKNFLTTKTSYTEDEDYLTALPEISKVDINKNIEENKLISKKQEITTDTRDLDDKYDEHDKINVTESIRDTPPLERAPSKPKLNPKLSGQLTDDRKITFLPITTTATVTIASTEINTSSPTAASDTISGKGAIRKTTSFHPKLRRQQSRDEYFDSDRLIRREGNLDRGRRFPRPPVIEQSSLPESQQSISQQKQQSKQEQQLTNLTDTRYNNNRATDKEISIQSGNNIKNLNLSGSIATTNDKINQSFDIDDSEEQYPLTVRDTKIQFSLNKGINRTRSSPLSSSPLQPPQPSQPPPQSPSLPLSSAPPSSSLSKKFISLLNQIQSTDSKDCCSIGSNKSSGSQSPISEGSVTRRKIKYIDQKTFYTEEERDILIGKREAYSNLSGISEYSLDSEFSIDTQMPAFGDLTMDHEEAPIMTTLSSEKREHLYKILVIGELGTGKTSFIKRYVHQFFSQNYRATIGVDFALKVLHWDKNTLIRLQLWDIAGQERFGNMTRVYYKEAVGAFIVFDVTRNGTFDCVSKWKEDLDSKVQLPDGNPIPCILLANKCDQDKQCTLSPEKMDEYCREYGFAGWFETSAKDNINIEEAATSLVNKILLNDKLISASDIVDNDKFALGSGSGTSTSQTKKSCSC